VRTTIARMSRDLAGYSLLSGETDSSAFIHRLQQTGPNFFVEYVAEAGGSEIALYRVSDSASAIQAYRSGILKNKIQKP
jgi:hypothetical protein